MSARDRILAKLRGSQPAQPASLPDLAAHYAPRARGETKAARLARFRTGIEGFHAEVHVSSEADWPALLARLCADKQVGIADVITSADGAPIAAGFMAWSQCFFPWTLDYDEIDLVLEGELHIRCNGQTFVGKAGDVFYIPKGSAIEFGTTTAVRFFYVTYPANWQG